MSFVYDSYGLKYSDVITITGTEEKNASLELQEASMPQPQLSGFVFNGSLSGNVISNALVSVFDMSDNPIANTHTDDSGYYRIKLSSGDYQVVAGKNRFHPCGPVHISLGIDPLEQHLLLQPSISADRVIYGVISSNRGPVNDARIDVIDSAGKTIASTQSIDDGEYSLPGLQNGSYTITVSAAGYSVGRAADIVVSDANPLVSKNVTLAAYTPPAGNATISGFITCNTGAIANAWVGLYRDCDALVDVTATSIGGYYAFLDVPPGYYVVKAKGLA